MRAGTRAAAEDAYRRSDGHMKAKMGGRHTGLGGMWPSGGGMKGRGDMPGGQDEIPTMRKGSRSGVQGTNPPLDGAMPGKVSSRSNGVRGTAISVDGKSGGRGDVPMGARGTTPPVGGNGTTGGGRMGGRGMGRDSKRMAGASYTSRADKSGPRGGGW